MNGLSEDDTSDSSDEHFIDLKKSNSNSRESLKPNVTSSDSGTEDESTGDEDFNDVDQASNIELFTQVLKNLEYSQKLEINDEKTEKEPSTSNCLLPPKNEGKIQKLKTEPQDTSFNEITELLLQGESSTVSPSKKKLVNTPVKTEDTEAPTEYTIPKDGVKITLPGTSLVFNKKKKKGGQDIKAILRRRLRASQILVEKVGLLCWLAYGFHFNKQINQPEIMAAVLSLISTSNYPKKRIDLVYLEKFTKWFKHIFSFEVVETNGNKCINKESLLKVIEEKKISDYKELVLLYIVALRALGLNCRLVISLCPPHRAYSDSPLFQSDSKGQQTKSKSKSSTGKEGSSSKKGKKGEKKETDTTDVVQNSPEAKKNANIEAKRKAAEILRSKPQKGTKKNKDSKTNNEAATTSGNKSKGSKDESETAEQGKSGISLRQLRSRKVNAVPKDKAIAETDGTKSKYYIEEDSTDSETEFQPTPKRSKNNSNKKEVTKTVKSNKRSVTKILSSDSETEEPDKAKKSQDIWAEIYLESEESWICASVMDEKIHCVTDIYKRAKKPVLYIVAWNSENLIKDVTRRYCPQWLTVTRKQRIDEKWWLETLSHWKEKDTAISRAEDEMLLQKELEQPLPKTIGECKGHPLYVIARHLLKFEALYPPDCVPLGHLGTGDAIYSRHCVHTLRSRETWLKQARVVKPKQEPYKIVKSRPKYDKLSRMVIKDSALELFGEWQTTEYEPPEAKDGIVPRNEYGNVDLFKQSMLPKGTVHVNLPGLNRIARKLNIDCAPAVVGFNFGCMGAVPAIEGYVVCSEHEDTLREAWEEEQVEATKRAKEKQEKRVYGNWKKLIHGLLIRERLAAKYEFSKEEKSVAANKRPKTKRTDVKKAKVL